MNKHHLLLIERDSGKDGTFAASLKRKGYRLTIVTSGRRALAAARQEVPTLIVLNASSLGSSGARICGSLVKALDAVPVIHVMPEGTEENVRKDSPADIALVMPFTSRKLLNRVQRLLPVGEAEHTIETGEITFAPELRLVSAYGREKRLTPKAAKLLEVFLAHPDQTLERSVIMQKVWNTDYVGDTRTLDVHVRWIREAVEPEPGKPHHIVTVRGVGYRFIPDEPVHTNNSDGTSEDSSHLSSLMIEPPASEAGD
ncbi:MAG: response regulator transcription factor [Chloroflexi bacterium]|nr:response regulator transcription factor [Chloroflexota bacterium]